MSNCEIANASGCSVEYNAILLYIINLGRIRPNCTADFLFYSAGQINCVIFRFIFAFCTTGTFISRFLPDAHAYTGDGFYFVRENHEFYEVLRYPKRNRVRKN